MEHTVILTLYLFIFAQSMQKTYQSNMKDTKSMDKTLSLSYQIEEELPPQSLIANVIKDLLKLQPKNDRLNKVRLNTAKFRLNLYEFNKDHQNLVRLNSQNGDLEVANRIDRESICPKTHKPKLDGSSNVQVQTMTPSMSDPDKCLLEYALVLILINSTEELWVPISLTILDINDNRPVFLEQLHPAWKGWLEIEIAEDVGVGYKCLLVRAFDADSGDNTRVEYKIHRLNDSAQVVANKEQDLIFNLDTSSDIPQLVLLNSLDYETKQRHMLELEACEPIHETKDKKCARIRIDILVKDVNDNAPVILFPPLTTISSTSAFYQTNISENLPVNALLVKVKAQDADSGNFGRITYYLKSESSQFGSPNKSHWQSYLHMHPDTGELRLARTVQAHEIPQFRLVVCARDNGPTPLEYCFTLLIHIQDVNNHAPDIQLKKVGCGLGQNRPTEIFVPSNIESGTHIGLLVVSDVDLGPNGKVKCHHAMNSRDFEDSTGMSIHLVETGKVSGRSLYVLQVQRDGLAAKAQYARPDGQHPVTSILITCNDLGQSLSLTSSVMLTVRMVQYHELDLCFEQKSYQLNIEETNKPIRNLIRPQLQDLALDIRFSIFEKAGQQNGCEQLEIELHTGAISAPNGLDRERSAFLSCSIVATEIDRDKPSRTAVAEIVINLTDINDNVPRLVKDIMQNGLSVVEWDELASLQQTSPILHPFIIGFLNAEDSDLKENGSVRYYLKKVTPNYNEIRRSRVKNSTQPGAIWQVPPSYELPNFQIDAETGLISLRRDHHVRVNREQVTSFDLEILLEDNGSVIKLSAVETVKLHVLDVNDNEPMWLDTISFRTVKLDTTKEVMLYELDPQWTMDLGSMSEHKLYTARLAAFDLDAGENSRLRMSLLRPEEHVVLNMFGNTKTMIPSNTVNLTSTGDLYLNTEQLNSDHEYIVFVRVQDNGARRILHCTGFFFVRLPLKLVTSAKTAASQSDPYELKSNYLELSGPVVRSVFGTEELRLLVIILFSLLALILLFGAIILALSYKSKAKRLKHRSNKLIHQMASDSPAQVTEVLLDPAISQTVSMMNTYPIGYDTNPTWISSPCTYVPTLSTENMMNSLYISPDLSSQIDYRNLTMRLASPCLSMLDQPNYARPNGFNFKFDHQI